MWLRVGIIKTGLLGSKNQDFLVAKKLSRTAPHPEKGKGRAQAGYRQVGTIQTNILTDERKKEIKEKKMEKIKDG